VGSGGGSYPEGVQRLEDAAMPPLPEAIIVVLSAFAPLFTAPTWAHAQGLMIGAVLCRGPPTVAAVLRVLGLGTEARFERYHRVLSRARWSGLQGSRLLLGWLVRLLPSGCLPMVGVDETLERRQGKRIKAKGIYRDAVRSSRHRVVKCFGLKWICWMLIVPLPWSSRPWALPFLTLLAPSEQANRHAGKRHQTTVDWTTHTAYVNENKKFFLAFKFTRLPTSRQVIDF
jgi:DDE superfamily endonuclease